MNNPWNCAWFHVIWTMYGTLNPRFAYSRTLGNGLRKPHSAWSFELKIWVLPRNSYSWAYAKFREVWSRSKILWCFGRPSWVIPGGPSELNSPVRGVCFCLKIRTHVHMNNPWNCVRFHAILTIYGTSNPRFPYSRTNENGLRKPPSAWILELKFRMHPRNSYSWAPAKFREVWWRSKISWVFQLWFRYERPDMSKPTMGRDFSNETL